MKLSENKIILLIREVLNESMHMRPQVPVPLKLSDLVKQSNANVNPAMPFGRLSGFQTKRPPHKLPMTRRHSVNKARMDELMFEVIRMIFEMLDDDKYGGNVPLGDLHEKFKAKFPDASIADLIEIMEGQIENGEITLRDGIVSLANIEFM